MSYSAAINAQSPFNRTSEWFTKGVREEKIGVFDSKKQYVEMLKSTLLSLQFCNLSYPFVGFVVRQFMPGYSVKRLPSKVRGR